MLIKISNATIITFFLFLILPNLSNAQIEYVKPPTSKDSLLNFSYKEGTYTEPISLKIKGTADGFYYTTDGTVPNLGSIWYDNIASKKSIEIKINKTTTLKIRPVKDSKVYDYVVTKKYVIEPVKANIAENDENTVTVVDNTSNTDEKNNIEEIVEKNDSLAENSEIDEDLIQTVNDNKLLEVSHKAGFYESPISLNFKGEADGFYYTIDGSTPNRSSSRYYKSENKTIDIGNTTVIRMRPFKKGSSYDTIITKTYFINFNSTFAALSISTNPGNFWDSLTGIYVRGPTVETDTIFPYIRANFWRNWERSANVEFFETDGTVGFNQLAGIKIFGGFTRALPEKSMRIVARKRYGKSRFKYKVFPEKDIKKFKSLVLRTSGGDCNITRFLDVLSTQLARGLDVDYQAYRPCVLFINGEYWGVYNIREKINKHFLKNNHGADPDSLDILTLHKGLEHGSKKKYTELFDFLENYDTSIDSNYVKLGSMMDIRNYINYRATEIYLSNVDSRGNLRYWQAANLDGKFRWILYDTDLGMGNSLEASHNFLHDRLSPKKTEWYNPQWSTLILRSIVKNEKGKLDFINQFAYLLNTNYCEDTVITKIEKFRKLYSLEMPRHFKRRGGTMETWHINVNKFNLFAKDRPGFIRRHLMEEFALKDTFIIVIDVEPQNGGRIKLNGNILKRYPFSGKFFTGIPIPLEACSDSLYLFEGWDGANTSDAKFEITAQSNDTLKIKARFVPKPLSQWTDKIVFNEICFTSDKKYPDKDWVEIYNNSDETIDLSNWSFLDKKHKFQLSEGTKLEADSYLVIAKNTDKFISYYSDTIVHTGSFNFGLSSKKETIVLLDNQNLVVDSLSYESNFFKKGIKDKKVFTLALKEPDAENSEMLNWIIEDGQGSPGAINPIYTKIQEKRFKEKIYFALVIVIPLILILIFVVFRRKKVKGQLKT